MALDRFSHADPTRFDQPEHPQAVTGLDSEAAWKRVAVLTGRHVVQSPTP